MPGVIDLPLRNGPPSEDIQGDILAGFNKDYRMYLFLQFPDQRRGRKWLKALVEQNLIANTRIVADFNDRFSAARQARGGDDPEHLKATWVNVSLTFAGLQLLFNDSKKLEADLQGFNAFSVGPVGELQANGVRNTSKAGSLNDIGTLSGPRGWLFGGIDEDGKDKDTIHALLNVQADEQEDLLTELDEMRMLIGEYGLITVFEQRGATLPGDRAGHEHFGYKDGISQPGVHGFNAPDAAPSEDPSELALGQVAGHLGTAIIEAGEFILGEKTEPPPKPPSPPLKQEPFDETKLPWMKNGSFQVFRRLEQDVPGFWGQISSNIHILQSTEDPLARELEEEKLGAKLIGRWRSGTPIDLAPERDDRFTHDPEDDNNFHFFERDPETGAVLMTGAAPNIDELGSRCPRFGHIRKVYPRANNFANSRIHRIIRRGVPFGLPFDPTNGTGHGADAERGLLFIAYMRSIEDQFEFLQLSWANNVGFPFRTAPSKTIKRLDGTFVDTPGPDPIIGTSRADDIPTGVPPTLADQQNAVLLRLGSDPNPEDHLLNFQRFVHTTGSLYAFVPSISTLRKLAAGEL